MSRTLRLPRRTALETRLMVESLETRTMMATVVANFSDLTLSSESYWNGPDEAGVNKPDPFGGDLPVKVGGYQSTGAKFSNEFNTNYQSWSGFAYSNITDNTTAGFGNQFSSFPGSGRGDANYAVSSGYLDEATFDPSDAAQLAQLPSVSLPRGASPSEVYVSNTTYAALSMQDGDSFAKKFGGATGNDPDFFRLTVYGTDSAGKALPASVQTYLADYRFADSSQDFILSDWQKLDLSALAGASRLYFNVYSSDVGQFGMNTPAFFALDDLTYTLPQANRAPLLDVAAFSPQLPRIAEDATNPAGTSVTVLLQGASDPDSAALRGVAITHLSHTNRGTWQYTLNNGIDWHSANDVTTQSALLLPATGATKIRFIPGINFNGVVSLNYRVWDQTQGTSGGRISLSTAANVGGTTAFSSATELATLQITAVNDAPVLGGISGTIGYTQNTAAISISSGATVTDVDNTNFNGGRLTVRVASGTDISNRIELRTGRFRIDASGNLIYRNSQAIDSTIGTVNQNAGRGLTKFEVTFNASATPAISQLLVRDIRFKTVLGNNLAPRTIEFSLFDGTTLGTKVTKTVNVV